MTLSNGAKWIKWCKCAVCTGHGQFCRFQPFSGMERESDSGGGGRTAYASSWPPPDLATPYDFNNINATEMTDGKHNITP